MNEIEKATIVKVFDRKVWIESDFLGSRHVMIQHDDGESQPFTFATFRYDWRYTSNSSVIACAESLARDLGATDPIKHQSRPLG